jgi:hypothetical protein
MSGDDVSGDRPVDSVHKGDRLYAKGQTSAKPTKKRLVCLLILRGIGFCAAKAVFEEGNDALLG